MHYLGYPHNWNARQFAKPSEGASMLYNTTMSRMNDPGLMMNMTRRSPAPRGTRKNDIWHRQGKKAQGARWRQGQQPRRSPRRLCCRPCRRISSWPSSVPRHVMPHVLIIAPNTRVERDRLSRSARRVPTPRPTVPPFCSPVRHRQAATSIIGDPPVTFRAVIYARYSSDLQSASSIEDQIRICRERAARAVWHIIGTPPPPAPR